MGGQQQPCLGEGPVEDKEGPGPLALRPPHRLRERGVVVGHEPAEAAAGPHLHELRTARWGARVTRREAPAQMGGGAGVAAEPPEPCGARRGGKPEETTADACRDGGGSPGLRSTWGNSAIRCWVSNSMTWIFQGISGRQQGSSASAGKLAWLKGKWWLDCHPPHKGGFTAGWWAEP